MRHRRAGWAWTCPRCCATSRPESVPQGGGLIGLGHWSLDVLDRLGIAQPEYVKYDSETVMHITVRDRRPQQTRRHIYPGRNTTWTLLHTALTRRLPAGTVHTGKRVTGLAERHGRPLLSFADGQTAPADLVVFCDGRASTGRRLLDPARRLHYAGYVAHRGTTTTTATGLCDFLRFEPAPRGRVQFNIAPIPAGADWTFYLGATAAQYSDWFGAAPARRLFALPRHVSPGARAHVDAAAARHLPQIQAELVHATGTRMALPVMDIDPPTRMVWPVGHGHAVLLGEALALLRPHTARGANNGIKRAAGLVATLTQHHRYRADLPAAIAAVHQGRMLGHTYGLGLTG